LLTLLWWVSRRELTARPLRVALFVGSIATGVALLTAMRVATDSIVAGFSADLQRIAGRADLELTCGTGEVGFPEQVLDRVREHPAVAQAAALVRGSVRIEGERPETVDLFGIDVLQKEVLELFDVQVLERTKDDFTILNDPRAVFVTDRLARERGLRLEDKVRISGVDGLHDYTVRGIFAARGLGEVFGGRLAAMYLPAAQPVVGRRGDLEISLIDQIAVRLVAGTDRDIATRQLQAVAGPSLVVAEPLQRRLVAERTVQGLRVTLVGMSTMALMAAIFIVYASTVTLVAQRRSSAAMLITIGTQPSALVALLMAEASILGAIGAVVGVGIGVLLAGVVIGDVAEGMRLNYSLAMGEPVRAIDSLMLFVVHPAGGVATALASAFLPARRLREVDPLRLQRRHSTNSIHWTLPRPIFAGGVMGLAAGSVALWHGVGASSSTWCAFGGVTVVSAAVIVGIPAVIAAWRLGAVAMSRFSGMPGRLAGENLARSLERSVITSAAIALCIAVAVGAGSIVASFRGSVSNWYGFSGDALVSSPVSSGGWLAAPTSGVVETQLRELPSVEDVETLRVVQGVMLHGDRIALSVLSPGLLDVALAEAKPLEGASMAEASARIRRGAAAAASENFVRHFPLEYSQGRVRIDSPTGTIELPLVAVLPDYVSDKGSLIVTRQVLAERWHDNAVNYFAVDLVPGASVESLREEVATQLGAGFNLSVLRLGEMIERVDGMIGEAFADIDTIKLLVIFLTLVGIADLLASNILDRQWELAVLRLVGMRDRELVRMMVLEALNVGIAASVLGVVVGGISAWVWVEFSYPVLVGYVLEFVFGWWGAGFCLVLTVCAAYLAAVICGRAALRISALDAARYE